MTNNVEAETSSNPKPVGFPILHMVIHDEIWWIHLWGREKLTPDRMTLNELRCYNTQYNKEDKSKDGHEKWN